MNIEHSVGGPPGTAIDGLAGRPLRLVREPPESYGVEADAVLTPDELDDLADRITVLSAHVHAATGRLARLLARFDHAGGWKPAGHESCANWVSLNAGFDLHTAREIVRVGRALEELPASDAAMARGALSFDQARALTRVAAPETEADLLELAEHCAPSTFRRTCRAWKRDNREDEAAREKRRHDSRRLSLYPDGDGMYRLDALLPPETAASTRALIDRGSLALYENARRASSRPLEESPEEAARRRADAFGLGVEWALATGYGVDGRVEANPAAIAGDAGADADASGPPISGLRAGLYRIMLHVDADTLSADGEPGLSELADGTRLAAETARRIACDCTVVRVTRDSESGSILNVGRSTRSIRAAIRRALEARDRGCRFPGCNNRFADGHHIVHWADGGETSLANTILLCRFHHRLLHEEGWSFRWWGRERHPVFLDRDGRAHASFRKRKPPPLPHDPVEALFEGNRVTGADPDRRAAGASWRRERDIPDEILFRALEAVAPD